VGAGGPTRQAEWLVSVYFHYMLVSIKCRIKHCCSFCYTEEARCVRSSTATSPNVTAFVQGPNGQYFVPG